ncbi:MAG: hypothetical protein N3J91_03630 [Verrucomicrobiae bacterium]|nr:hypothetical protein [Verrucomicrobiae bacterium]
MLCNVTANSNTHAKTGTTANGPCCACRLGPFMVLLLLASLGFLLAYQPRPDALPELARFAGRFHVLVLHFPIGLLTVAAMLSLGHWRPLAQLLPATPPPVVTWLGGAGALSAWLAAVLGWLLAHSGDYAGPAVQRHLYAGLACAAAALVAWALAQAWANRPESALRYRAMVASLLITNALVILAGHWGGILTHGEKYLWEAAPAWLRPLAGQPPPSPPAPRADLSGQPIYPAVIAPVLRQYCVECHNEQKAKGGLRLETYAETMEAVKAGQPRESELLKRLLLPLKDEDHMPPPGKPQPKPADLALLEWWIATGAPEKTPLRELNPPPPIKQHLGLE